MAFPSEPARTPTELPLSLRETRITTVHVDCEASLMVFLICQRVFSGPPVTYDPDFSRP